jgi:hypothetical protein
VMVYSSCCLLDLAHLWHRSSTSSRVS